MAQDTTTNNQETEGQLNDNSIWPSLYVSQLNLEDVSVSCDSAESVAEAVLDLYNIEYRDVAGGGGGELAGLDIKRMDAMTAVNWSLIERGVSAGKFIEPIMASDGVLEFRAIGDYSANISDVYYEISTGSYYEAPTGVLVTGGKPLPVVKPMRWYPIWGTEGGQIFHYEDMVRNCNRDDYLRYASIVFKDPQTQSTYNDGIENLYEINDENPWDRIAGYVQYMNPGPAATKDTKIDYTKNATILIKIGEGDITPDLGTLVRRPTYPETDDLDDAACFQGEGAGEDVDFTNGIEVEIPAELRFDNSVRGIPRDTFSRISMVGVIGRKIANLSVEPLTEGDQLNAPTIENSRSRFIINAPEDTLTKLDDGKHYIIAYDNSDPKIPYVVFINNSHPDDPWDYGKGHVMYPNPHCDWAKQNQKDGTEPVTKSVLPTAMFQGIMVKEIWIWVDLNIPSISIYDPDGEGEKALTIANDLQYYISPIVITEKPAPVAYARGSQGSLVDQRPITDTDPTTAQDFSDTELEQIYDEMQGGGMSITYSFLDENNVEAAAGMLYQHFQSDVVETVYTCGPNCNPILGGYGDRGGVINSIRYNYTDSGSYTVSVTEGQKLASSLSPVDGGPSQKMAENHGAGGTVIDQMGDNIHFKVRIDGYGERWAVNMAPNVIRIGDVVQCTVHNNPVEA